ncbi:MAG: leucyl aminopeptidase [Candidatus Riflebacteria bacterium]|nr:leucyl aminopeptidase [Candidatus Riflebacteria bacterium]
MDHLTFKLGRPVTRTTSQFIVYPAESPDAVRHAVRLGLASPEIADGLLSPGRIRLSLTATLVAQAAPGRPQVVALELPRPGVGLDLRQGSAAPAHVLSRFFGPPPWTERYRQAWAEIANLLRAGDVTDTSVVVLTAGEPDRAAAVAEGLILGSYAFDRYLGYRRKPSTERCVRLAGSVEAGEMRQLARRAITVAESVNFARDLVNTPAKDLGPQELEDAAAELARDLGLKCRSMTPAQLRKRGLEGIAAVGQGSPRSPRLIVLEYAPARPRYRIALVGKGVTFDSGGLSLKDGKGMEVMKKDMAGAAACLGALRAAAMMELPVQLTVFIPAAENMPDGTAQRPGDIIRCGSKTIEVTNTDAEGRLILADALVLAQEQGHDAIVDVATLTGEAGRTFGNVLSPVLGNDWTWVERLLSAGLTAHERFWPLPLLAEYREPMLGEIADLKNASQMGGYTAGSILAGAFLAEFSPKTPWVHLDIANTSWSAADLGYLRKGATGVGVRVLVQLLRDLAAESVGSEARRRPRPRAATHA